MVPTTFKLNYIAIFVIKANRTTLSIKTLHLMKRLGISLRTD
jgi:hypothetical protein